MRGRRRWIGLLAVALAAAGCTTSGAGSGTATRATTTGAPPSRPTPTTTAPPTGSVSDEARIYAAAIGGPGEVASQLRRVVYLSGQFCTGMIDIGKRGPCASGPIPDGIRSDLMRLVGPNLHITDRLPQPGRATVTAHIVVVRLGTAQIHGSRARVAVDMHCGLLCGQGETLLLAQRAGRWVVTGQTGYSWIS
ncbi:MAG: hypothetical protein ACRDVG_09425 [Jatrophihabitantaceae bacterium]